MPATLLSPTLGVQDPRVQEALSQPALGEAPGFATRGQKCPLRAGSAWKWARHGPAEDSASDSDRAGVCPPLIPQAGLAPASALPLADCDFGHVPHRPPTPNLDEPGAHRTAIAAAPMPCFPAAP